MSKTINTLAGSQSIDLPVKVGTGALLNQFPVPFHLQMPLTVVTAIVHKLFLCLQKEKQRSAIDVQFPGIA